MANYTNLSTLSGLKVGDVVTYTTETAIDFNKCKVRIELYGKSEHYHQNSGGYADDSSSYAYGGKTQFDIQSSNDLKNFYYTPSYGSSLMFDKTQSATSRTVYYRIGVAGDAGSFAPDSNTTKNKYPAGSQSTETNPSLGGGTTGKTGFYKTPYSGTGATGGSQTSGGTKGATAGSSNTALGSDGSFATGGTGATDVAGNKCGNGGAGWYGGGGGSKSWNYSSYVFGSGGGGSGFVIGNSTTTYPSGYMGSNNTDITSLVSAISNATLTQGGSTETAGKMVLTILEVPKSFPKYYNGTTWIDTIWKRYNGSSWEDIDVKYYDGTNWQ